MRGVGLGLLVACLFAGQAVGEESAGEAITASGLLGTWSTDCSRDPIATCERDKGCGNRTIYQAPPPSGPPVIKNIVGTVAPGVGKSYESIVESAVRIAADKIKIISIMQGAPGDINKLAWLRQPGDRWETVLTKDGNDKFRFVSSQSEDGRKIAARDGLVYLPPPGTKPDEIPANWERSDRAYPTFERCLGDLRP